MEKRDTGKQSLLTQSYPARMRVLPLCLLLCACAAAGSDRRSSWAGRWPELAAKADDAAALDLSIFRARRPDREQDSRLDQAIVVYVEAGDEAFVPLRDRVAADPVTAFWLARTLGFFTLQALARAGDGGLMLAGDPAWQRPLEHLGAMGAAAVPFVVLDLIEHPNGASRDLGARILKAMGPGVVEAWSFLSETGDLRVRRMAMQVLSTWPPTDVSLPLLEEGLVDPDFGIRAAAYRGLARAGSGQAERMRQALASEKDPFVRRAILESMTNFKDRGSALAVLAFLEWSLEAGEYADLRRADAVLQEISGLQGSRDLAGWRAWIETAYERS